MHSETWSQKKYGAQHLYHENLNHDFDAAWYLYAKNYGVHHLDSIIDYHEQLEYACDDLDKKSLGVYKP